MSTWFAGSNEVKRNNKIKTKGIDIQKWMVMHFTRKLVHSNIGNTAAR